MALTEGEAEVSASRSSGETKSQMAQGTEPHVGRHLQGHGVEGGEVSLLGQIRGRGRQKEVGVHLRLRPTSW